MLDVKKILEMEKEVKGGNLNLGDLKKENTALVVVDMVNGFVHEGVLASPRIKGIIKNIADLNNSTLGYKKIFFLDEHEEDSIEYKTHGIHCKRGTKECELIPELKENLIDHNNIVMIPKNSTNGFHAPLFKNWLSENENTIENYIVVGCEVDICVINFAVTLKTYFNQKNMDRRIIVPADSVETYDLESHDGDLMKIISLYNMQMNGIEIVDSIII
ncbi:isochorismatase family cysteine hydrolase [Clostridium sp. BJN0013]|uniref:isochorismatase family cysteine hydrolase n=1 Tax=Clostridium sp. BJN0013 TaxID=3236840 RepID=UPI0034C5CFE4